MSQNFSKSIHPCSAVERNFGFGPSGLPPMDVSNINADPFLISPFRVTSHAVVAIVGFLVWLFGFR